MISTSPPSRSWRRTWRNSRAPLSSSPTIGSCSIASRPASSSSTARAARRPSPTTRNGRRPATRRSRRARRERRRRRYGSVSVPSASATWSSASGRAWKRPSWPRRRRPRPVELRRRIPPSPPIRSSCSSATPRSSRPGPTSPGSTTAGPSSRASAPDDGSLRPHRLDLAQLVFVEIKGRAGEVLLHVPRIGGAGERQHPHLLGEAKDELSNGLPAPPGHADHLRPSEDVHVGGEEREPLVDNVELSAEAAHVPIPVVHGEAAVLDVARHDLRGLYEQAQLTQAHVADTDDPRLSSAAERLHLLPHRDGGLAQPTADGGAVQHVGVEVVGAKMLQRRGEGLPHLGRVVRVRIVRETMILAARVRELGLEEQVLPPEL